MVLPDSRRVSRVPRYSGTASRELHAFRLRGFHPLRQAFPNLSPTHEVFDSPAKLQHRQTPTHNPRSTTPAGYALNWFGLIPVRSPLLGESRLISFPGVTEMVQFTPFTSVPLYIQGRIHAHDGVWVSPFGNPRIEACLAAPRGLSQLSTSFIVSRRQGIHRTPLVA